MRGTTQRVSHVMRAHSQTGKLLDIGCATGIFLKSMQNIGWVTAGVETNAHAAEIARAEHGLDVRHGELRNNMFPPDYFDVVTMWDVLEHVSEPRITLGLIAESLVPGGWLLLRIPNPQGLEKRIFGNNWSGWDVPRHLTLFSEATLNTVLIETGFEPRWRAGSSGQFAMLALSIRYFLASRNFKNSLFLKMFRGVPGLVMQLALSPLLWLLNISKQSSVMTIAAQKIAR